MYLWVSGYYVQLECEGWSGILISHQTMRNLWNNSTRTHLCTNPCYVFKEIYCSRFFIAHPIFSPWAIIIFQVCPTNNKIGYEKSATINTCKVYPCSRAYVVHKWVQVLVELFQTFTGSTTTWHIIWNEIEILLHPSHCTQYLLSETH